MTIPTFTLAFRDTTGSGTGGNSEELVDVRKFGLQANEDVPGFINDTPFYGALASGEKLLFPPHKTFLFGSRITVPAGDVFIQGTGKSSVLKLVDGANDYMLYFNALSNIEVENITLDGNKDNQTAGGTNLFESTSEVWLHNVWSRNSYNNGFLFDQNCWNIRFGHLYIDSPGAPGVGASGGHGLAFSGDNNNGTGARCKNIQGDQIYIRNPKASGVNFSECENAYIGSVICIHDGTGGAHTSGYGGVRFTNGANNCAVSSVYVEGMSRGVFIAEGRNIRVLSGRAHRCGRQGIFVAEDDIDNVDCTVVNFVVTEPCQLLPVGEQQGVYLRKATRFDLDVYVESTDGKMVSGIIEHADCIDSNISLRTNAVGATTTNMSLAYGTTGGLLRASKRIGTDFSGLQIIGGSSPGGPTVQPFPLPGSLDANIPLQFFAQGTDTVRLGNGNGISLRAGAGIADMVNYTVVHGAAINNGPVYTVGGTDTNIPVNLRPVGASEARILSGDGTLMFRAKDGGLSFRGVAPVAAPVLSAALPTDGSATNAAMATAINVIRTALINQGLAL